MCSRLLVLESFDSKLLYAYLDRVGLITSQDLPDIHIGTWQTQGVGIQVGGGKSVSDLAKVLVVGPKKLYEDFVSNNLEIGAEVVHVEALTVSHPFFTKEVFWNSYAPVIAFSDGSCSNNGGANARAGFASLITGAHFKAVVVRGSVAPSEYRLDGTTVEPSDGWVAPSNNRGELLGIIYCMLWLIKGNAVGHVEIVSDSDITIKTLEEWLPTRRRKGTAHELKNFDLVQIAEALLLKLRGQALSVRLTHIRSHRPDPGPRAPAREKILWTGNGQVDEHAAAGARLPQGSIEVVGETYITHMN